MRISRDLNKNLWQNKVRRPANRLNNRVNAVFLRMIYLVDASGFGRIAVAIRHLVRFDCLKSCKERLLTQKCISFGRVLTSKTISRWKFAHLRRCISGFFFLVRCEATVINDWLMMRQRASWCWSQHPVVEGIGFLPSLHQRVYCTQMFLSAFGIQTYSRHVESLRLRSQKCDAFLKNFAVA